MRKKRWKEGGALLLVLALLASVVSLPKVLAADPVEVDRECSVTFGIAATDVEGNLAELQDGSVSLQVELRRVASIDTSGTYHSEGAFAALDVEKVSSKTTAEEWTKTAEAAQKIAQDDQVASDYSVVLESGAGQMTGLTTGLYLVNVQSVQSAYYTYSFEPYLISLPTNHYYAGGDDAWIYDLDGGDGLSLKPEQKPRYGSLVISKTMADQNVTFGEKVTVVFRLDITTLEGENSSRVAAIDFDGTSEGTVEITDIPAGATVKVTEEYSGAGYELVSVEPADGTVTIMADGAGDAVVVSFVNQHDGTLKGGYGIINQFELDENNLYNYVEK